MIRLTDEEIENTIRPYPPYLEFMPEVSVVIKAQLKKVYEWGNEPCPHWKVNKGIYNPKRRECDICWSELKKEIEG